MRPERSSILRSHLLAIGIVRNKDQGRAAIALYPLVLSGTSQSGLRPLGMAFVT
jgi:hypothetical protein